MLILLVKNYQQQPCSFFCVIKNFQLKCGDKRTKFFKTYKYAKTYLFVISSTLTHNEPISFENIRERSTLMNSSAEIGSIN